MDAHLSLKETFKEWKGTFKSYLIGFVSSLLFTSLSFYLVVFNILSGRNLTFAVISLAACQAICQLLFFLHLGQEDKPRWESLIFAFMLLLLTIIVGGTLWIMQDLNDRTMMNM